MLPRLLTKAQWVAPFWHLFQRFTASQACRQIVKISGTSTHDGRIQGRVTVFGKDLSLRLVEEGLAWHVHRENRDPALAKAEREARQARENLWSDDHPIAPWVWRLGHRLPARSSDVCY